MNRSFLLLAVLGLVSLPVRAQSIEASAFALPTLDVSARGAALGGSPAALPGSDPGSFYYNPALLLPESAGRIALGFVDHVGSLRAGTMSYSHDLPGIAMVAGGVRYLGWGAIPKTDETGAELGTFRANELAVSLAASRIYGHRLRYGIAVHGLRTGIDDRSAGALIADAGVLLHWPERRFALSASVHALGFRMGSLGETDDALETDVRLGVSKRLAHLPLLFTVTVYGLNRTGDYEDPGSILDKAFRHLLVGAEFQFSDAFQLRFGYDHRRHAALKIKSRLDVAGLSMGAGIKIRRVGIDYAWSSWSSLGGLHRFTVTTRL